MASTAAKRGCIRTLETDRLAELPTGHTAALSPSLVISTYLVARSSSEASSPEAPGHPPY
ncbi:hypothetical protein TPAR_00989 [Tolypocladium paradoxum]|uniref:Uncharacterized protein n=1 Tax=Tolypocladium paradoxum TaxID=94208 RepID=A0A2S4L8W3_9HYPO|nr:hypothetical protein TPAR_00989 [Tolypocladium paradoxum]